MDGKPPSKPPGCNEEVESGPVDLNKGDDVKFEANKYAIDPIGGFIATMKRILKGE